MSHSLEQIKSINHHFRHAIEQVTEGIVIVEADVRHPLGPVIVFANRAATALTGYDQASLLGQPIGLVYDPEALNDLILRLPRVAEASKIYQMEKGLVTRSGRRETCRWTISAVRDAGGRAVNFTLTFSVKSAKGADKADDRGPGGAAEERNRAAAAEPDPQLEDSLEKSRVESLALLAGGIAHDFNNVLQTILTNLSLAALETSGNSPARTHIEDAVEATQDAQQLAQQILDFTKGRLPQIQIANLGDVLKQVAKLATMGSKVRCDLTTPEDVWGVEVDLRQIRQVIHNLMINACQSMPDGGVVQASVSNVELPSGSKSGLPAGHYVMVRVRDRGCGISEKDLPRIFEPYYTTKKNGTGIGLATCRAIVQRHHGTILVSSRVNVGTEFQVYLPACVFDEPVAGPARAAGNGDHPASGTDASGAAPPDTVMIGEGRVLVVDDQDSVREAAERLLERLGYRTVSASDGQEAVRLYRQHSLSPDPINAVLLDMTLPGGLSGDEVMEEIRRMDGRARVIATSGYFDEDAEDRFREDGYIGILPKPYAVEKLSQKLAEAMSN